MLSLNYKKKNWYVFRLAIMPMKNIEVNGYAAKAN